LRPKSSMDNILKSRTSSQPNLNLELSHKPRLKKSKNKSTARLQKESSQTHSRKELHGNLDKKFKNYNNTVSTTCGDSKKINSSSMTKTKKSSRSSKVMPLNQMKILSPKDSYVPYWTRKKSLTRNLSPSLVKADQSQQVILDILQRKNSLNCFKKMLKGKQMESTMSSIRLSKGLVQSTRIQPSALTKKQNSKKSLYKAFPGDKDSVVNVAQSMDTQDNGTSARKHSESSLVNPKILDAMNEVYEKLIHVLDGLKRNALGKEESRGHSLENSLKKEQVIQSKKMLCKKLN
jgi:hypothetical protein